MPDRYIDEETETRTLSLCLFDVAGITVLNRCANCPGAARASIQHRRCPREALQPNIFRPEDPDSKISALKSSASSSKQQESGHREADTVLPDSLARLSLVDSAGTAGTFGRSESDPDIPGGRAEPPGTPRILHGGVKRKAKLEDLEESSSLAKSKYQKNELDHLSVPDYLKLKPQKRFRDLESENLFMSGCLRVSSAEMTALNISAASPMDTQERPSGKASRPFVAGCCVNTELDGYGLLACDDGIESEECEVLACCDEMEI